MSGNLGENVTVITEKQRKEEVRGLEEESNVERLSLAQLRQLKAILDALEKNEEEEISCPLSS